MLPAKEFYVRFPPRHHDLLRFVFVFWFAFSLHVKFIRTS